jgi:hypothetical protein
MANHVGSENPAKAEQFRRIADWYTRLSSSMKSRKRRTKHPPLDSVAAAELAAEIDRLRKELDRIKTMAREEFEAHDKKRRNPFE